MATRRKSKSRNKTATKRPAKPPAAKKAATKKASAKKTAARPAAKKSAKRPAPKPPPRPAPRPSSSSPAPKRRVVATSSRPAPRPAPRPAATPTRAPVDRQRAFQKRGRAGAGIGREGPIGLPHPDWLAVEGVGDERRRFRRVPKQLKIRLFAEGKDSYLEANLQSHDMSLSGIFLRSTFFLPEGTNVRIEFDAPWGQVASAGGTVARVRREGEDAGFGIKFKDLDESSLTDLVCIFVGDHIQEFVEGFLGQRGRSADAGVLWEGILAWEIERLRKTLDD